MEGIPQIIPFKNSPDLKMLSRSWPVDGKKKNSDKGNPHAPTIEIHPREDVNQWFADPKISWTKPEFIKVYKQFLKRRYKEINFLQEELRRYVQPEMIKVLEQDLEQRQKFFKEIQFYEEVRNDLFKLIKQKNGSFTLTPLNNIIDDKRTSAFFSLTSRVEHNTRSPMAAVVNTVNIFKIAPQLFQKEMLDIVIRNLHSCFNQIDSLFDTLRNPSHQADLREFNIDEYLQELETECRQIAGEHIKLNWTVQRNSNADYETFTNDTQKIKDDIVKNLIENAKQHLQAHPDLPCEINVEVSLSKVGRPENTMKFIVSNPTEITDEQFARLTQFKMGFSTKIDKSKNHGIALVTAKELCESALGGEFEITKDANNNFIATVTIKDLGKKPFAKAA